MATTTTQAPAAAQLLVTISDLSMLKDIKKAISMLKGVTTVKKQKTKPRLYDPETGEYLNDETMKVIEDALKGKNVTRYESADDLFRKLGINV
jgi:antitoxin component of RelBE/YafQ-DinJ toxin-antitoxin module